MAGSHMGREASLNHFSTGVENIPLFETGMFVRLVLGLVCWGFLNRSVQNQLQTPVQLGRACSYQIHTLRQLPLLLL